MSQDSAISWTDDTINPWWGCVKVSPACTNCYAETLNKRFQRADWTKSGHRWLRVHKAQLELDRSARRAIQDQRARRVFIASMSDFFEDREDLVSPRLSFWYHLHHHAKSSRLEDGSPALIPLILTKRPDVMARWAAEHGWPEGAWAGTTVEDQRRADERIPELLKVPARRFLSCEPLLGAVDLTRWVRPLAPVSLVEAPSTWEEWNAKGLWPEWVPQRWRGHIESFWSCFGRRPANWIRDCHVQGSPPMGARMTTTWALGRKGEEITGRWVHTWNNMGILVTDDGEPVVTSTPRAGLFDFDAPTCAHWQGIHWVIVGGESGSKARPMHPAWARSIRDQCAASGVPFHFKQVGAWSWEGGPEGARTDIVGGPSVHDDGAVPVWRVGTKAAGRLLDGQLHDEVPHA